MKNPAKELYGKRLLNIEFKNKLFLRRVSYRILGCLKVENMLETFSEQSPSKCTNTLIYLEFKSEPIILRGTSRESPVRCSHH